MVVQLRGECSTRRKLLANGI
ncbi:hypothetical protein Gorai_019011 [Gossypium raimondii]|uniref:Uncharacterized protein n=1 Tax=Gossypium raimondii TaxID=29730 RepID=A0A7J8PM64_GOSRA|nr:hypothetical protein [Gossypium raimondii]